MSWAVSTIVPSEVPLVYGVATAGPLLGCGNFLDVVSPRRTRFNLPLSKKCSRLMTFATESNQVSLFQSRTWEDPDDGSGSEYDEEEVDEYDLGLESDWEGEGDVQAISSIDHPATNKYEEDLQKGFQWPPLTFSICCFLPLHVCFFLTILSLRILEI